MFVEGLWSDPTTQGRPGDLQGRRCRSLPEHLIQLRSFLPWVPPALLWPEVRRWRGTDAAPCIALGDCEASADEAAAWSGRQRSCVAWRMPCFPASWNAC